MAPHPVRETNGGAYRSVETKSSTMSSLMCCTSKRSQQAMTYKESQKKFLWLDPNRWSGQKKEKVRSHYVILRKVRPPQFKLVAKIRVRNVACGATDYSC